MRKICFFFLLSALACTAVNAQKKSMGRKQPNWGLKTGINLANLRTDGDDNDQGWRTGFVFGAFFKIRAGNSFAVQPEFLYSSMGGKNNGPLTGNATTRLNYFSIPLLAKYKFCNKLSAVAGPQFDFLINAKRVLADADSDISGLEDHSINATAGFEFWPSAALGFSARYIHGFTEVYKSSSLGNTIAQKNQAVQLTLAVKL